MHTLPQKRELMKAENKEKVGRFSGKRKKEYDSLCYA